MNTNTDWVYVVHHTEPIVVGSIVRTTSGLTMMVSEIISARPSEMITDGTQTEFMAETFGTVASMTEHEMKCTPMCWMTTMRLPKGKES